MYCSDSWSEDHGRHTQESSIEDCEARCLADSSCLAMTFGLSTGSYPGDCIVCTGGTTLRAHASWISRIRDGTFFMQIPVKRTKPFSGVVK